MTQLTINVLVEVDQERFRQDEKWGPSADRATPPLAVLIEEVGEVANAQLEGDKTGLRKELIQVAAVATAMVEGIDRGDIPWR